jgi:hypothetical protein
MTKIHLKVKKIKIDIKEYFCIFHNVFFLLLLGQLRGNFVFDQI